MTDDQAIERLETLIATQQPAKEPWQPVTDYSFEARKEIEGIHPQLIKDVFQPTRVLDYGAGYGHLVRLLREHGIKAWGYEPHLPLAKEAGHNRIPKLMRDGYDYDEVDNEDYDLVICREVLEHLTLRPLRETVMNLCELSSRFVYVTTRFAKYPDHLLDVDTADDLDPDHRTMLNQNFLRLLFVLEGFKRRADLEAQMDHRMLNRVLVYERGA